MKKYFILYILLIIFISGCSTSARNTPAIISDIGKYDALDCDELHSKADYLAKEGTKLSKAVDRERTNDMVLIGSFGLLSTPAVNLDPNTARSEFLSIVKGDMKIIEQVSITNNCPVKFQSNESEEYIVDNSTNPVLGLSPIDQNVVYKVIK